MSTVSGFVLGVVTAASLTVLYSDKLGNSLREAVDEALPLTPLAADIESVSAAMPLPLLPADPVQEVLPPVQDGVFEASGPAAPSLEQRWAEFAARAAELQVAGQYPWRACFQRAAASYALPESLLLAIASGESNFDPAARSDKDAIGLMQIRWPDTSRHLGVPREADLYDPCTNVDAGARYLLELAGQFDHNLHRVVAAYNYGPGRIGAGEIPEGARWYSQYIYQHLQKVLGEKGLATSELTPPPAVSASGQQVLLSFNVPHRARDFIDYLKGQVPELDLQQRSESLGRHDVVLLYRSEPERQRALESISAAGVLPLGPELSSKRYL